MNLPTERLVLAFGAVIAVGVYAYWTWHGLRHGLGWTGTASFRAGVALAAVLLLALVLRLVKAVNRDDGTEP